MKTLCLILCLSFVLFAAQDSTTTKKVTKKPVYLTAVVSSIDVITGSIVIKNIHASEHPSSFSIKVRDTIMIKYLVPDTTK